MKYAINVIVILLIAFGVWSLIKFKSSDSYDSFKEKVDKTLGKTGDFIKAKKESISVELKPERERPLTFIGREATLKQFKPVIFDQFEIHDWRKFWNVIYEPVRDKSEFGKKYFRTKDEIASYFISEYEHFSYFSEGDWSRFWQIVLK